jgi:hypothetical protein
LKKVCVSRNSPNFKRIRIVDGIRGLAEGIAGEFYRLLPRQRKTQHTNLSLLVATMLNVRSANLMDLAAGLPRDADRIDMPDPVGWRPLSRITVPRIFLTWVNAPFRTVGYDRPTLATQAVSTFRP